jgi:hypothetical protein
MEETRFIQSTEMKAFNSLAEMILELLVSLDERP